MSKKLGEEGGRRGFTHLCAASGVLRGPTGDEDGIVVLDQVVVEPEMLLLGENGIVGFQAVLLKQLLISVQGLVSNCHTRVP